MKATALQELSGNHSLSYISTGFSTDIPAVRAICIRDGLNSHRIDRADQAYRLPFQAGRRLEGRIFRGRIHRQRHTFQQGTDQRGIGFHGQSPPGRKGYDRKPELFHIDRNQDRKSGEDELRPSDVQDRILV